MKTKFSLSGNAVGVRKKDLPVVVRELKRIEKEIGVLTPAIIVKSAERKRSPLRKYFQWNNTTAAQKYREWQARALIGCVQVTIVEHGESSTVRAFVNVSPSDEVLDDDMIVDRSYVSVQKAARNVGYRGQVLLYARNQLINWKRRFGGFKEFFGVVEAIEKLPKK